MNIRNRTRWDFQIYLLYLPFILAFEHNTLLANLAQQISIERNLNDGIVYRQTEVLKSSKGLFGVLEWTVHWNESKITFDLTKSATGSELKIVLGLSKKGNVDGADLVILTGEIGGPYNVANMIGTSFNTIKPNSKQLWRFEGVKNGEDHNGKNITVSVSRLLNTCDLIDKQSSICINDNMVHIIWGSVTDNYPSAENLQISKTFSPEGTIKAYLTDPQMYPESLYGQKRDIRTWRAFRTFQLHKSRHTSYWCNVLKAPLLSSVHHIVGYIPYFVDVLSKEHVHHQLLYRCVAPPGLNSTEVFEPLLEFKGEECILENTHQLPMELCTELVYGWSLGGKPFYLTKDLGIPIGETRDEYFMLQIHYDNPSLDDNLVVESGVDVLYSREIRPVESSLLFVGVGNMGLFMVPPNETEFRIGGLCSSDCTTDMFSGKGEANIRAVNLHAHLSTHKIYLRHFRGDVELPVILKDENFDARFQIMRHLKKPVRILPGDQLGVECVLSTGNKTKLSGFSARDEMCFVFVLIDKRTDYMYCSSEYPTGKTLARYGIQKVSWDKELQERVIRQSDGLAIWEGKTLQNFLDSELGYLRESSGRDLEREQMFGIHDSVCPPVKKLMRVVYKLDVNKSGSRNGGVLSSEKILDLVGATTETVSTPGFLKAKSQWPQINKLDQIINGSGRQSKFEFVCFQIVFIISICI